MKVFFSRTLSSISRTDGGGKKEKKVSRRERGCGAFFTLFIFLSIVRGGGNHEGRRSGFLPCLGVSSLRPPRFHEKGREGSSKRAWELMLSLPSG